MSEFADLSTDELFLRARAKARIELIDVTPQLGEYAQHFDPVMVVSKGLAPLYAIMDRVFAGEQVFALIEGAPRHGKSTNLFAGFARHLQRYPKHLIGYGAYNQTFANSQSRLARNIAEKCGVWSSEAEVAKGSRFDPAQSVAHWQTAGGGGAKFVGRGGSALGSGFNLACVDDPLKNPEEAESEVILTKTFEWILGSFFNRLEPNGSFICTHQRWNDGDPIGRFKDRMEKGYPDAPEAIREKLGAIRWDIVTLKAIQDDGTPLMPHRFTLLALARIQAEIGEFYWWAQYMQDPRPRGGRLFPDQFPAFVSAVTPSGEERGIVVGGEFLPIPREFDQTGIFFVFGGDTATSDSATADATAVVLLMCWYEFDTQTLRHELRADVLFVWEERLKSPDVVSYLARIFSSLPNAMIAFETMAAGKAQFQFLQLEHPELNIVEIKTTSSKRIRANACAAGAARGRLRVAAQGKWVGAFCEQLRKFTGSEGKRDDKVDAVAHAWNLALSIPRPTPALEGDEAGEFRSAQERDSGEGAGPFS